MDTFSETFEVGGSISTTTDTTTGNTKIKAEVTAKWTIC
jgi:hypothetical protein